MRSQITTFPYDSLVHYKSEDVAVQKKVLNAYSFLQGRLDIFKDLLSPLTKILKSEISMHLTHLAVQSVESIKAEFSENVLFGTVNIEPHAQKAFVVFETLLAKILVYKILAGEKYDKQKLIELQTKPLTVLEEAIIQYVMVSIVENFSSHKYLDHFSLNYQNVFKDVSVLSQYLSKQSDCAVFSVQLHLLDRNFYLKLILPLSLVEPLSVSFPNEEFYKMRLAQLSGFDVQLDLQIAQVTLNAPDFDQIAEGDILLFDETQVSIEKNQLKGRGELKINSQDYGNGYLVDLSVLSDRILAQIMSAL